MKRLFPALAILMLSTLVFGEAATKPAPASQPANMDAAEVVNKLNDMPQTMWPTEGEQPLRVKVRDEWIAKAIKGAKLKVSGKVIKIDTETRNKRDGNHEVEMTPSVILDCGDVTLWGGKFKTEIRVSLPDVKTDIAAGWNVGEALTISGSANAAWLRKGKVIVHLGENDKSGSAVIVPAAKSKKK